MAPEPEARPLWRVTYLDFSVIVENETVIEKAQAGDVIAQSLVIGMIPDIPRNHLKALDGSPDPVAPFRNGLKITRVA